MSKPLGENGLRSFNIKISLSQNKLAKFNKTLDNANVTRTALFKQFVDDIISKKITLQGGVIIASKDN